MVTSVRPTSAASELFLDDSSGRSTVSRRGSGGERQSSTSRSGQASRLDGGQVVGSGVASNSAAVNGAASNGAASNGAGASTPQQSFQSSLWDAFRGTPAPAAAPVAPSTRSGNGNTAGSAASGGSAAASGSSGVRGGTGSGGPGSGGTGSTGNNSSGGGSSAAAGTGMRGEASTSAAGNGSRTATPASVTVRNSETGGSESTGEAETPVDEDTQFLNQVGDALRSVGWDPAQFNLRVGAMEIVYPGKPTYDYPVMWANINGSELAFYLGAAKQNPGMVAINISGMMGRPVMHLI